MRSICLKATLRSANPLSERVYLRGYTIPYKQQISANMKYLPGVICLLMCLILKVVHASDLECTLEDEPGMTVYNLLTYYKINTDNLCGFCSRRWQQEVLPVVDPQTVVNRYLCSGTKSAENENLECVDLANKVANVAENIRSSSLKGELNLICCRLNNDEDVRCSNSNPIVKSIATQDNQNGERKNADGVVSENEKNKSNSNFCASFRTTFIVWLMLLPVVMLIVNQ